MTLQEKINQIKEKAMNDFMKECKEIKSIKLNAFAYPDSGRVNGVDDPEEPTKDNPPKMPFLVQDENNPNDWRWTPEINLENGTIVGWPKGTKANVYYKPVDDCAIYVDGEDWNEGGYVPDFLSPKDEGYGYYIIMDIDENGKIENWDPNGFSKWIKRNFDCSIDD